MLYILHTNVRPDFDSRDPVPLNEVNVRTRVEAANPMLM